MARDGLAYYNEIDSQAATWLRNLIAAGHIAPGIVDERDIAHVQPRDVEGYAQCHFFAGIGTWSHALRRAGWPDHRRVWTGSCPCQPFSAASKGRGKGLDDARHLWPEWRRLIGECGPNVIFGEQVASPRGLAWLDVVWADLEAQGYAFAPFDLCAAGFGAPHIRQRLFIVAESGGQRCEGIGLHLRGRGSLAALPQVGRGCETRGAMGDTIGARLEGHGRHGDHSDESGRLAALTPGSIAAPSAVNGFWADAEWTPCRDGKARPFESGTFPLAYGATSRVVRLRAYGNAIVSPVAEEFIRAYMTAAQERGA